jgi:hypothetical protein
MGQTKFVKWPRYEEYKEMLREHLVMDRRDDGVLLVRMHTKGGRQLRST